MKSLIILLLLSGTEVHAEIDEDRCKFFKYCGGAAPRSSQSLPSASTSASFNPSNIASIKGFGVETLLQPKNDLGFNVVSGTGNVGGALISPTLENSFFGNRSLELDEDFLKRRLDDQRYKNSKINLALGIKIIDKPKYALDLGFSAKRNPKVRKINPGVGFSAKLGFLNFGGYIYKDDVDLDLTNKFTYEGYPYFLIYETPHYQETYTVRTLTVGTKIKNLALDFGMINSKYKFYGNQPTEIKIYSGSYNWNKLLFNFAFRQEDSPNMEEVDGRMVYLREKTDTYFGIQYMMNSHFVFGVGYNTFLLDEVSGTVTIYL